MSAPREEIVSLQDREHLLLRPDTLCGAITPSEHVMPLFHAQDGVDTTNVELREQFTTTWGSVTFAPAVRNLFQEILTNALDRQFKDDTMRKIDVWVNCAEAGGPGYIRIVNDGAGVPVLYDEERQAWKPTIAFSHFRSGTNFVDGAGPRFTAGRNGYGCKATNVFSKHFIVKTADPQEKKQFHQEFRDNMGSSSQPVVKSFKLKKGYTDVSFLLDFARLGCSGMTDDIVHMVRSTVITAACCLTKKVTMSLNGITLGVKHLRHVAALFGTHTTVAYDAVKEAGSDMVLLEVAAVPCSSPTTPSTLGFVNSLECCEGTHVNYALTRTVLALEQCIRKQFKKSADFSLSPSVVKKHVFMVVKVMVDSPAFSSQTKEKLSTAAHKFGFEWTPSASFVKALVDAGVVSAIAQDVQDKELLQARKSMAKSTQAGSTRRMVVADKYDAATSLRSSTSKAACSLLVTEGDSARALAVAGLAVVGREHFGIYALKGKPLNVRNATMDAIVKNKEVSTLLQILGLTYGKVYTTLDELTYKKLVIFSDQDPDGAHIGGLLLNVIHALFPSILHLDPAFVQRFPTPLVRVTHKRSGEVTCFYAKAHYDAWAGAQPLEQYTIKYFKGLGTSTSALAREYFSDYDSHLVNIVWTQASDAVMVKMFSNDQASQRRELLQQQYNKELYVDYSLPSVTYEDFVYREVLPYSNYSNIRNIASVIDGLKPVQRKALFTMLDKHIVSEVKVAQVAAVIASHTMYHHGEQSLVEAVVGMAQDHVGVSNINLLKPEGQFGSRLDPPSEHSAARYIFTALDPITRYLFPAADDAVLEYNEEEGARIEPSQYAPVLPMVLINGAFGIGTGWSTFVPCYNPLDIVQVCAAFVSTHAAEGEAAAVAKVREMCDAATLKPWYDGFKGTVMYDPASNKYVTRGEYTVSGNQVHITELPVGTWTHTYVEDVEKRLLVDKRKGKSPDTGGSKKQGNKKELVSFIDKQWTDSTVDMVLHCQPDVLATLSDTDLIKLLNLESELRMNNMHLHNSRGTLVKYDTVADIVIEFALHRLELYTRRKTHLMHQLGEELFFAREKQRFIALQLDGSLHLRGQAEDAVVAALHAHGLGTRGTDFLLAMPLKSLTADRVAHLQSEVQKLEAKLQELSGKSEHALWLEDLHALQGAYTAFQGRKLARYTVTGVKKDKKRKLGTGSTGPSKSKR